MVNQSDFSKIQYIDVVFTKNRLYPELHEALNGAYASNLPDHSRLFDPAFAPMTELHDAHVLIPKIHEIIINEMILPNTDGTHDHIPIKNIIMASTIKITVPDGNIMERSISRGALETALGHARAKKLPSIQLVIDTNRFFLTSIDHITYHDWTQFTLDRTNAVFPENTRTPVSPTTNVTPPPPAIDYTAMATAISAALAHARISETTPSPPSPTSPYVPSTTTAINEQMYSPSKFPDDVRERYDTKREGQLILGSTISTPFRDDNFYYNDFNGNLVLADGTLHIKRPLDEKGATRNPPKCKDDSFAGIRRWYTFLASYLANYGIYIHPLWCFRPDHGGKWGFTYGSDNGCDLPQDMDISLFNASPIIYRILMNDMFKEGSKLIAIVDSCPNDGYHALQSIMVLAHPAYQPQPATLITSYPIQRDLTLHQFFNVYTDYLQLRAYIRSDNTTLDDPAELDIFLSKTRYAEYLNRITYSERTDPQTAAKYKGPQLPTTLQTILNRPDSPIHASKHKAATTSGFAPQPATLRTPGYSDDGFTPTQNRNRRFQHQGTRINQINAPTPDATTVTTDNTTQTQIDVLVNAVNTLSTPPEPTSRHFHEGFVYGINQLKTDPQIGTRQCCICKTPHAFKDCPVLQDIPYIQQQFIQFQQLYNRHSNALQQRLDHPHVKPAPINYYQCLETNADDNHDDNSVDSFKSATDFQQGRP